MGPVTDPSVPVPVEALEALRESFTKFDAGLSPNGLQRVVDQLISYIPEPEWEPTDAEVWEFMAAFEEPFTFDHAWAVLRVAHRVLASSPVGQEEERG